MPTLYPKQVLEAATVLYFEGEARLLPQNKDAATSMGLLRCAPFLEA